MIFQAMGAKYTLVNAWRHATIRGRAEDRRQLEETLGEVYDGKATLYHKGRSALAEAIRLATGGSGIVAISGLTCYSVVQSVKEAGCNPLYADISEETLQPEAEQLTEAIETGGVKAIVLQHMLGLPVDIDPILQLAKSHGIMIIEDLAHSAGANYADGREVGTVGDYTVLSFGKDKAFDVVNGGALIVRGDQVATVPDREVARKHQRHDRWYPLIAWVSRKIFPIGPGRYLMGLAIRIGIVELSASGDVDTSEMMPKWQARLAIEQVTGRKEVAKKRAEITKMYQDKLAIQPPKAVFRDGVAPIRLPLLLDNRDEVVRELGTKGIIVPDIWYDMPVATGRSRTPVDDYPTERCPVAVKTAERIINLPTHERISQKDVAKICAVVNEVARS